MVERKAMGLKMLKGEKMLKESDWQVAESASFVGQLGLAEKRTLNIIDEELEELFLVIQLEFEQAHVDKEVVGLVLSQEVL
eukprot:CAMPEP_0168617138 /NCGR_PEP_ID=MMETSP0449_2-20121227/5390_1 /TAXON_ID=1082188 /ORGANISM="Strombidium rassoulzadegani, Strain ras09" /LENGTH=80 /DNA_ID=CAMNT_0008657949 /DNA_START=251 /DNA_END=491 /DNA_ORIENTATION=-